MVFITIGITAAEDSGIAKLFSERKVKGTIIISSLDGKVEYLHNKKRAAARYLPASTFKMANTLIALDEGVLKNEKEIIKWDGKDRGWGPWNKDQSLETALPISCVWFYQELAKRIGDEKYLSHLFALNYGNRLTGSKLTTFWLEGDLGISAMEQIGFLKKLYKNDLPYKEKHIQLLKNIMVVDKTLDYVIRAKTGLAARINKKHGWYVGYVEAKDKVWFFALNMDIKKKRDAAYRKEIVMKALRLKGVI